MAGGVALRLRVGGQYVYHRSLDLPSRHVYHRKPGPVPESARDEYLGGAESWTYCRWLHWRSFWVEDAALLAVRSDSGGPDRDFGVGTRNLPQTTQRRVTASGPGYSPTPTHTIWGPSRVAVQPSVYFCRTFRLDDRG